MSTPREMLLAIAAKKLSQQEIADRVLTSQPTIQRIMKGTSQPLYETGKRIEELYAQVVLPADSASPPDSPP